MKKSFIDKMAAAYLKMYNVKESLLTVCYSNVVRGDENNIETIQSAGRISRRNWITCLNCQLTKLYVDRAGPKEPRPRLSLSQWHMDILVNFAKTDKFCDRLFHVGVGVDI